jgi:hypothetical protein
MREASIATVRRDAVDKVNNVTAVTTIKAIIVSEAKSAKPPLLQGVWSVVLETECLLLLCLMVYPTG